MSLGFLFKEIPSKVVWSSICMVVGLIMALSVTPAHAGWFSSGVEQSGINLFDLGAMVWAAKDELPWYQLVALVSFLMVPIASLFTSITPTPKEGTLWSFVYKYIEATALTFFKAKDKPVDTVSRKIDGKPIDVINDSMGKLSQVGAIIDQAVKTPLISRVTHWFKGLF